MQEAWVPSLGWEDPLGKGMATHSSILAWRIPWTEEPGGLQSMGLQRGQEKVNYTSAWPRKTEVESSVHTPFCYFFGYCSDFWLLKKLHVLKFSFLTLCSCLQQLHNDFLLLSKESMPDLVIDTAHTEPPQACWCVFVQKNLMRTLCLTVWTPRSPPGHTPCVDVGAFPASSV